MKKAALVFVVFIVYTLLLIFIPAITNFDIKIIGFVQNLLSGLPLYIPDYIGRLGYSLMIAIPLIVGGIYFIAKKMYKNLIILYSIPIVAYLLNTLVKLLIHRPRPPYELQLVYHPHSFSYVSRHTFVSACLWGMVIYFVYKYCKNPFIRNILLTISGLWIILIGISRVWIGVHYPTDVVGAYILASCFLIVCVKISDRWC